jgi:hypothetical protein
MLGALGTGLLLFHAPWVLHHPEDQSLSMGTVRAPVWQAPHAANAETGLNKTEITLEVGALWAFLIVAEAALRIGERPLD